MFKFLSRLFAPSTPKFDLKALDIQDKFLVITGDSELVDRSMLEALRMGIRDKGGMGVIFLPTGIEIHAMVLEEAILRLTALRDRELKEPSDA